MAVSKSDLTGYNSFEYLLSSDPVMAWFKQIYNEVNGSADGSVPSSWFYMPELLGQIERVRRSGKAEKAWVPPKMYEVIGGPKKAYMGSPKSVRLHYSALHHCVEWGSRVGRCESLSNAFSMFK